MSSVLLSVDVGHLPDALLQPPSSMAELDALLKRPGLTQVRKFTSLHKAIASHYTDTTDFFQALLPSIIAAAARYSETMPAGLQFLTEDSILTITKRQCHAVLCAAFLLCYRRVSAGCVSAEDTNVPNINFDELYDAKAANEGPRVGKLRMLLHYFETMRDRVRENDARLEHYLALEYGVAPYGLPVPALDKPLVPPFMAELRSSIDDAKTMVRVDFANAIIGGGAIAYGCVQEEIMFAICPELIVSRLFVPCLKDNEALALVGAEQFTLASGYAFSLGYGRPYSDTTPHDTSRNVLASYIVAIDALCVNRRPSVQYNEDAVMREAVKVYAAGQCSTLRVHRCFATGNWGCGAFGGDPELKALIQWAALSAQGITMHYYPFDNERLAMGLPPLARELLQRGVTCGALLKVLCECSQRGKGVSIFHWVHTCLVQDH